SLGASGNRQRAIRPRHPGLCPPSERLADRARNSETRAVILRRLSRIEAYLPMAHETLRSAPMMKLSAALLALFALMPAATLSAQETDAPSRWSLAIHGGAGTLERANMTAQQQVEYKAALQSALDAGAKVLR